MPFFARQDNNTHLRHFKVPARLAVFALLFGTFAGVASAASKEQQQKELRTMAQATLSELYRQEPGAQGLIKRAAGYAVFSNSGMKLGVAGTDKGKGIAVNNATKRDTFMKVRAVQAGLGFGIKKYRLVWVFETQSAFDAFVSKGRQIGGQAAFTARASGKGGGAAGAASVDPGVWLYQLTDDGLAAEITIKASKYFKDNDLN